MKVCIAGGGRVGMYLAQSLLSHRHKVTIIEPQESLCRTLADTLDIPVICGDSLSFDTLRTADVASCDAFVAVTNTDETNLVACQIAKREFGVNRTVARASNPKNRDILHTLGVDTVVCGTDNLSHILEREIETDTIRQLLSLGGGTASLNEILLPEMAQLPPDTRADTTDRSVVFFLPAGIPLALCLLLTAVSRTTLPALTLPLLIPTGLFAALLGAAAVGWHREGVWQQQGQLLLCRQHRFHLHQLCVFHPDTGFTALQSPWAVTVQRANLTLVFPGKEKVTVRSVPLAALDFLEI